MVAGGIVSIVTRKGNKAGDIAIIVLLGIAALLGYTMGGIYVDLIVWSTWCVACAVVAIISLLRKPEAVQKRTAPAPRSSEQGSSLVQCPFNYTSKDMVRAEAMSSYVTRFEFNFGLAEGDCSCLLYTSVSFTFRHSHRPSSIEIFDCVKVRFISPPSSRT